MNRDVYIKFFPDAWRADEQLGCCSLAARGLWIELMSLAHKYGGYVLINGRVPTLEALAKAVRAKAREVKELLVELVHEGVCSVRADGAYFSRRMVRDFEKRKRARANGLKGGNPDLLVNQDSRNQVNQGAPTLYSLALASESESGSTDRKTEDPHAESFARFWQRYPKRKSKHTALAAWRKLAPDAELVATIHAALDWQVRQPDWLKEHGQFVPLGATWLNQRRWEDERTVVKSRGEGEYRDWFAECKTLHGGTCNSQYQHGLLVGKSA